MEQIHRAYIELIGYPTENQLLLLALLYRTISLLIKNEKKKEELYYSECTFYCNSVINSNIMRISFFRKCVQDEFTNFVSRNATSASTPQNFLALYVCLYNSKMISRRLGYCLYVLSRYYATSLFMRLRLQSLIRNSRGCFFLHLNCKFCTPRAWNDKYYPSFVSASLEIRT